jgi:hypothetical protein
MLLYINNSLAKSDCALKCSPEVKQCIKNDPSVLAVIRKYDTRVVAAYMPTIDDAVSTASLSKRDVLPETIQLLVIEATKKHEVATVRASEETAVSDMSQSNAHVSSPPALAAASLARTAMARLAKETAAILTAEAATLADLLKANAMEALLRAEVQKKRGRDEEASALDAEEKIQNVRIEARNAELRVFRSVHYAIGGKCDGVNENDVIVELKMRRNWFSRPPVYDVMQLKVYLKLFGKMRGQLIEQQQNGSLRRETDVTCNESEWTVIHDGLNGLVGELRDITVEKIISLAKGLVLTY